MVIYRYNEVTYQMFLWYLDTVAHLAQIIILCFKKSAVSLVKISHILSATMLFSLASLKTASRAAEV